MMQSISLGQEVRLGLQLGHSYPLSSASFSPDGRTIVTASDDQTARLWDAATGREIRVLSGHAGWVSSASFSPDGRTIVTASDDQTARLWDAATGREIRVLSGHKESVLVASFSPDGRTIVTASDDQTARLWDAATGREIRVLSGHAGWVSSASFSPDGRTIVTASDDQTARLWDAATGREIRVLSGHKEFVTSASFSPDGRTIVTASFDKTVRLWDAATGREIRVLAGHAGWVSSASFSPDGRTIVTASLDQTARLWDAATGRHLYSRYSFTDGTDVVITPDGRFDGTGFKHLHWVRGPEVIPLEAFFEAAYTPGLVGRIMKGEKLPPVSFNVSEAIDKRPTVRITSPSDNSSVDGATLVFQAEAIDRGLGVREIRAFLNGQRIDEARDLQKVPTKNAVTRSFRVDLAPGRNVLRVVAFSSNGIESEPAEITVTLAGPYNAPELHVVAVGINQYANPAMNLRFARRDAEAFSSLLQERAKGAFAQVHMEVITDSQATRAGIIRALEQVKAKARPQDAFVLFFAGHGVCDPASLGTDEFFLVTSEVPGLAEVPDKALSLADLRPLLAVGTGIKAGKKLLILDACQAGAAAEKDLFRSFNPEEAAFLRNSRSNGWLILASSLADQVSREIADFQHGLFTYSLLGGMRGSADSNKDGRISTFELNAWLADRMEAIARERKIPLQRPVSAARGEPFDLVIARP